MKKNILVVTGIAGMLLGVSPAVGHAEVDVRVGDVRVGIGDRHVRPAFVVNARPNFVYVPDLGFSVAVGSPYDFMYYGDLYYIYNDGIWYSSSYYGGPWIVVRNGRLPLALRRHRIGDIRRFRDMEYRRHDSRYWEGRERHDDRHERDERGGHRDEGHDRGEHDRGEHERR